MLPNKYLARFHQWISINALNWSSKYQHRNVHSQKRYHHYVGDIINHQISVLPLCYHNYRSYFKNRAENLNVSCIKRRTECLWIVVFLLHYAADIPQGCFTQYVIIARMLTHKQLEKHESVINDVATDALVLKDQVITTNSANKTQTALTRVINIYILRMILRHWNYFAIKLTQYLKGWSKITTR